MASIRKYKTGFRAEVRLKNFYKSKIFDSKIEAQKWAVETEHAHGKSGKILRGKTVKDAFDRYAREVSPTKKGARWETVRLEKLSRDDWVYTQLADLKSSDLRDWRDRALQGQTQYGKPISPASVRREFTLISSVIEYARREWHWINENPCRDVSLPDKARPRDRRISAREQMRIVDALGYDEAGQAITARQQLAVAFLLAIETAMRQGEIYSLEWPQVHLERRFVTLLDTKNNDKRDVPLSGEAVRLLGQIPRREQGRFFRYPQASAAQAFRKVVKGLGIEDLRFHDTRHEGLTRLARKLTHLELARMVGHRDVRSLMIYYNATAEELAAKLD